MGFLNIKSIAIAMFAGFVIMLAANADVSAQSRREIERERQRIQRENQRYERARQGLYRNDGTNNVPNRRGEQRIANENYAAGYEQGLMAGQSDRRSGKYNRLNVYRDTGSSPNDGDPSSADYIYRQGYLQGYNDGFNGIRNY